VRLEVSTAAPEGDFAAPASCRERFWPPDRRCQMQRSNALGASATSRCPPGLSNCKNNCFNASRQRQFPNECQPESPFLGKNASNGRRGRSFADGVRRSPGRAGPSTSIERAIESSWILTPKLSSVFISSAWIHFHELFGFASSIRRGRIQGSRIAIIGILSRPEIIPWRRSAVSSVFSHIELHKIKALQTHQRGDRRWIPLKPI
jgi:hypothetical protein